ncbi:MAG: hypothetical protein ACYC20_10140, partial [Sulfurovum sp.]
TNQWAQGIRGQWQNVPEPTAPTKPGGKFAAFGGTTMYVPQPTRAEGGNYYADINVNVNVPPGANVDTQRLAQDVANRVEQKQQGRYMNQHRAAAAKLQAVPTG